MPYCGKRFWTRQIPISCFPTLVVFIHIEHICTFFVTFFSATIDGRNLIFGHKLHIGTPYRGKRCWTHQIPTSCLPTLLICIHIEHTYAHFSSHFSQQLLMAEIWYFVTIFILVRNIVLLDPSDSYFLFVDLVGFYTHWTYMHIFRDIFLSNYWWQKSNIWSQASYRYPISWEAFLDPSDSYFLFADLVGFYTHWTYMRGYHKWALAHSSSCFCITLY
jgi:hypothetical protein